MSKSCLSGLGVLRGLAFVHSRSTLKASPHLLLSSPLSFKVTQPVGTPFRGFSNLHGVLQNNTGHKIRWISSSSHQFSPTSQDKTSLLKETTLPAPPQIQSTPQTPPLSNQTSESRNTLRDKLGKSPNHENIYNLPNFLTFTRLLAAPAVGYLVLHDYHVSAALLFAYAGLTDLVDGWIARRWNLQTVVGSVVDPMADKLLMTILTVCLAVQGALPVWLATLILGRDVALAFSACYYRYASLPTPKTLARFWDFSLPSAQVHPTAISKANTFLQLLFIGAVTAIPAVSGGALLNGLDAALGGVGGVSGFMNGAQLLVAGTTVWSGASYLYTKNAVEILTEGKTAEEKRRILVRGKRVLGASFAACLGVALYLES